MPSFRPCKNPDCIHLVLTDSAQRYCCAACKQRVYRLRRAAQKRVVKPPIVKACRYCGKSFVQHICTQRFCSTSCRSAFWQYNKRLSLKGDVL
jgi:hypothetical protein